MMDRWSRREIIPQKASRENLRQNLIRLPEYPANCAWGGSDNRTMFFTSNTSIYSLRMKTPGTRIPRA